MRSPSVTVLGGGSWGTTVAALSAANTPHTLRALARAAAEHVRPWVPLLSLIKGLEPGSRLRATQVIAEELTGHPVGLLAGPNLAREVLDGYAAAAVIATADADVALALQG